MEIDFLTKSLIVFTEPIAYPLLPSRRQQYKNELELLKTGIFGMKNSLSKVMLKAIVSVVILGSSTFSYGELIFSAPPRESAEKGMAIYGPLADQMSNILGETVTYQHPGNWPNYSRDMRAGVFDIVFDAPHFGAWRIEHLGHTPLVKLPGVLDFVVVTTNPDYTKIKQLVGKRFCGLASPNMGTLTVQHMFSNPTRQPSFVYVKGGFAGVYSAIVSGKCVAGVLRHPYYAKKLTKEQRNEIHLVKVSNATPNQTLTVSSKLSEDAKQTLLEALTDSSQNEGSSALFNRFSKGTKAWVETDATAYTYLNLLLEGHAWGWLVE